jgi:transposase
LLKTTDFVHLPSENNDEKKKLPAAKAFKTRLYPTTEQRSTLHKWFGVSRWIYNKCLHEIVNNNCPATLKELRKRVINNDNFKTENTWMLAYDYDLRDESLQDLLKNYKSNIAKGGNFQIQFKTLKEQSRKNTSISVLSKKWNKKKNFYTDVFNPSRMKSHEALPDKLDYTSRLIRTPLNQYFISVPRPLDMKCENQAPDKRIISIDPGVRTFLTCYDPSGQVYSIGNNDAGAIARLQHYKRKLQGCVQSPNTRHKQRYKMKLAMLRINKKIQDKVSDFHRRVCKWLCENFTHVIIPKLNFHKCKKLSKRQKALLASLRHCELVDRLVDKAREYPWCKVQVVGEAYTSKTCGKCGWMNEELKSSKTFECKKCQVVMDRDVNGSRNILLRAARERCVEA